MKDANKVVTVSAYLGQGDKSKEISYTDTKVIGNGSFGVVYQARLCDTDEVVAVKKVLQDRRFKVSSSSVFSIGFVLCRAIILSLADIQLTVSIS